MADIVGAVVPKVVHKVNSLIASQSRSSSSLDNPSLHCSTPSAANGPLLSATKALNELLSKSLTTSSSTFDISPLGIDKITLNTLNEVLLKNPDIDLKSLILRLTRKPSANHTPVLQNSYKLVSPSRQKKGKKTARKAVPQKISGETADEIQVLEQRVSNMLNATELNPKGYRELIDSNPNIINSIVNGHVVSFDVANRSYQPVRDTFFDRFNTFPVLTVAVHEVCFRNKISGFGKTRDGRRYVILPAGAKFHFAACGKMVASYNKTTPTTTIKKVGDLYIWTLKRSKVVFLESSQPDETVFNFDKKIKLEDLKEGELPAPGGFQKTAGDNQNVVMQVVNDDINYPNTKGEFQRRNKGKGPQTRPYSETRGGKNSTSVERCIVMAVNLGLRSLEMAELYPDMCVVRECNFRGAPGFGLGNGPVSGCILATQGSHNRIGLSGEAQGQGLEATKANVKKRKRRKEKESKEESEEEEEEESEGEWSEWDDDGDY
ncbi:hypothetical protein TrST_g9191 [Triparma strigata]|uniref:Uncharacterized protein n=1 Tax=Triparma strigata TaxID=1606541 RepID=A0A9W7AS89_9STRA|nr:hypothetical protein TrST_g9191 [Triparma strigata]